MGVVKIKNINRSYINKSFTVRGRIKPQPGIHNNFFSPGIHFRAILFDKTSAIQIVAFGPSERPGHCDNLLQQLQTDEVVSIDSFEVLEIPKAYEVPDHKYQIKLDNKSVIKILNKAKNPKIEFSNFPKYIFTKGNYFNNLVSGMSIDVLGQIFQNGNKIKVDSTELDICFWEKQTNELPADGNLLCIYNATFKRENTKNVLNVVRYSFFKVITPEEYRKLSSVVSDLPVNRQYNGQNITPHRTEEAAGSSIDQNPQIANAPLPSTNSPNEQRNQSPQISNTPLPSTSSPYQQRDQSPQISGTPSPNTSSGHMLSAQKDSTSGYSGLKKRPMQSLDDNQTKMLILESPLSDENFIRNLYGRLEEFTADKKQEVQLKILNLIENELQEFNNYDYNSELVKLENE